MLDGVASAVIGDLKGWMDFEKNVRGLRKRSGRVNVSYKMKSIIE